MSIAMSFASPSRLAMRRLISRPTPASSSSPIIARTQLQAQRRAYSIPAEQQPMDAGEKVIYDKLSAKFPGKRLEVQDVSGGCGSFYAILISSPAFKGLTMIKQHKLVNDCLKEDIKTIHGLQLKTIVEE